MFCVPAYKHGCSSHHPHPGKTHLWCNSGSGMPSSVLTSSCQLASDLSIGECWLCSWVQIPVLQDSSVSTDAKAALGSCVECPWGAVLVLWWDLYESDVLRKEWPHSLSQNYICLTWNQIKEFFLALESWYDKKTNLWPAYFLLSLFLWQSFDL